MHKIIKNNIGFKLNNIDYDISNCSIRLYNEFSGIRMYIEVNAETKNQEIDFELRNVSLYHKLEIKY